MPRPRSKTRTDRTIKEDIESYSEMEWNYEPARREYLEALQEKLKESEK